VRQEQYGYGIFVMENWYGVVMWGRIIAMLYYVQRIILLFVVVRKMN